MTPLEIVLIIVLVASNYLSRRLYADSLRLKWLAITLRAFVSQNAGGVIWTAVDENGNPDCRFEPIIDGDWRAAIDRAMEDNHAKAPNIHKQQEATTCPEGSTGCR